MRRASRVACVFVSALAAWACGRSSATREPPPAPVHSASASPSPSGISGTPGATNDPCADIRAQFNDLHAKRTDTCTTNADCACYNPVGGPQLGCGGVTDASTAKKLAEVEKAFHASSCRFTHDCAAWSCSPKCTAGRCSR